MNHQTPEETKKLKDSPVDRVLTTEEWSFRTPFNLMKTKISNPIGSARGQIGHTWVRWHRRFLAQNPMTFDHRLSPLRRGHLFRATLLPAPPAGAQQSFF